MSREVKIPEEIYSRLEACAAGFDTPANVIEKLLNHYEGAIQKQYIKRPNAVSTNNRDRTKYCFNKKEYAKCRLVLAVVQKYVSDNPGVNIKGLQTAFSKIFRAPANSSFLIVP